MATTKTSTATATSFSNTPQAVDDLFSTLQTGLTEDSANTDIVHLDVMLNDLGGAAKTLYSLDNATSDPTATKILAPVDLLTQDTARDGSSTDTSLNGAKIWITTDGKVAYEMTDASRTHFQSLAAGDVGRDTFTYAIRLGNGTLSWATATVEITGTNDAATAPADNDGTANSVNPHAANGTTVGITAHSTDPDVGDTLTYELTTNPSSLFAINASTGIVTVANSASLNAGSYAIGVDAVDNHGAHSSVSPFTITVIDTTPPTTSVSHAPSSSGQQVTFTVIASDASGIATVQLYEDGTTQIGIATATATGSPDTYTCQFNANTAFFLQNSSHAVSAKVFDTAGNAVTVNDLVTVTVNNSSNTKFLTPAGVAGAAINLALADPSADHVGPVSPPRSLSPRPTIMPARWCSMWRKAGPTPMARLALSLFRTTSRSMRLTRRSLPCRAMTT